MKAIRLFLAVMVGGLASAVSADAGRSLLEPGGNGARYATDAYPGFDDEDEMIKPERKEPRWFSFIFGPNRDNAPAQYAYCQELVADGDYSKACKQLDALVREWPTAPEAWKAQQQMAELLLERLDDAEEAFRAFRYLLDFYSLQCDYQAIADRLYKVAGILQVEGKEIMFVRFENTVDVRRAFETCVLRAPGAKWVPEAMLTIASLREKDGRYAEAVKVYENLRNLYPDTDAAKTAIILEAESRMALLREHAYNRARCRDTLDFLKMSQRGCRPEDALRIQGFAEEVESLIEEEAYRGAKFYDSRTRTKRSAINAYEKFLEEYPESVHADEIRERLETLKEGESL